MKHKKLCEALGYSFHRTPLLHLALTHRSFSSHSNNERLEFLGDAVVNFIVGEMLYFQFPDAPEGDLTRWRATLINRDTLGKLGQHFELGNYLSVGPGELKSGGNQRQSTVSCAMEAIIGAIYLDGGFDPIRECLMRWYMPLIQSLSSAASHRDPKTALQEYLQRLHLPLPVYTVESLEGQSHKQLFVIHCSVASMHKKTIGKGTSRKRAEQEAASHMLGILQK